MLATFSSSSSSHVFLVMLCRLSAVTLSFFFRNFFFLFFAPFPFSTKCATLTQFTPKTEWPPEKKKETKKNEPTNDAFFTKIGSPLLAPNFCNAITNRWRLTFLFFLPNFFFRVACSEGNLKTRQNVSHLANEKNKMPLLFGGVCSSLASWKVFFFFRSFKNHWRVFSNWRRRCARKKKKKKRKRKRKKIHFFSLCLFFVVLSSL